MSFFSLTGEPMVYKSILTYSIEQSPPWEPDQFSVNQDITRILWNPNVHYCIHKCLPPVPILSRIKPVHASPSHFLQIILILSCHLRLGFPSGLFPSGFPTKTLYTPLPHMCYMPYPSHSSQFDHPINIGWGVQIIKFLII